MPAEEEGAEARQTTEEVVLGEGGVAPFVDAGMCGSQSAPDEGRYDVVQGVKCSGVPVGSGGGHVQDVGHRGGAEKQVGLVTAHEGANIGELAVGDLEAGESSVGTLDVEEGGPE